MPESTSANTNEEVRKVSLCSQIHAGNPSAVKLPKFLYKDPGPSPHSIAPIFTITASATPLAIPTQSPEPTFPNSHAFPIVFRSESHDPIPTTPQPPIPTMKLSLASILALLALTVSASPLAQEDDLQPGFSPAAPETVNSLCTKETGR